MLRGSNVRLIVNGVEFRQGTSISIGGPCEEGGMVDSGTMEMKAFEVTVEGMITQWGVVPEWPPDNAALRRWLAVPRPPHVGKA